MKNQTRENQNEQPKKWFTQVSDTLMHHKPKNHLVILGSIAAFIFVVVIAVTLPKIMAASAPESSNDASAAVSLSSEAALAAVPSVTPSPTPAPTAIPTPTPTPDPTLQTGDQNERVQQLQEKLMELNYLDLDESTQLYGPATKYAVELFQRQHGLTQDGIAGPATLDLLYSDTAKKYTLLEGTSGSDVDSLQRQLIDLGYLGTATGYYGTETSAAVMAFQERNGLSVDGKTGEQTLALLYSPNAVESATKEKEAIRSANITTFLDVAQAQLGDPYILGNTQVTDWEKITSMDNLQVGDILFFSTNGKKVGHTGIYIGNGEMIDASSSNGKVVRRSCTTTFWQNHFVVARRPW